MSGAFFGGTIICAVSTVTATILFFLDKFLEKSVLDVIYF